MLSLNNVTKKYGNFTALEDINLEFSSGVYALLAPNGAGKTTLIKMLTTLIFPTRGEILWICKPHLIVSSCDALFVLLVSKVYTARDSK